MKLFKFIGAHTGGRESITCHGTTFYGNEPAEVTDEDGIRRLSANPEFEAVDGRTKEAKATKAKAED